MTGYSDKPTGQMITSYCTTPFLATCHVYPQIDTMPHITFRTTAENSSFSSYLIEYIITTNILNLFDFSFTLE